MKMPYYFKYPDFNGTVVCWVFFLKCDKLFFFFPAPILLASSLLLQGFTVYSLLIWLVFERSSSMFSVCKQLNATIIKEAI